MAKYTKAISLTLNDNDGKLSFSANPESTYDINRHYKMFGKWHSRFMFFRAFWLGLRWLEEYNKKHGNNN